MQVAVPQVGESVTEAHIGPWLKNVGDPIKTYESLVELVTDKVSMEMPSPATGTLSAILVKEGTTVPIGTIIAEIDLDDNLVAEQNLDTPLLTRNVSDSNLTGTLLKDTAPVGPTGSGAKPTAADSGARYSPAVARLAAKHGIDPSMIKGTGIDSRVTRKDIQEHIDSKKQSSLTDTQTNVDITERIPLSPVRRIIADNMTRSANLIPEAWSTVEIDVTELVILRESVKTEFQETEGIKLTYMPFIVQSVASALRDHPIVNSSWDSDSIILKKQINIGIAVAAPKGLVVPVIKLADTMDLKMLARTIDDLVKRARSDKLELENVRGGTFTVNNTGSIGSVVGKGIINHPEAAILNTEAIVKRPVVIDQDITVRSIMNLCITFDHRILDGVEAGAFVRDVKNRLENIDSRTIII